MSKSPSGARLVLRNRNQSNALTRDSKLGTRPIVKQPMVRHNDGHIWYVQRMARTDHGVVVHDVEVAKDVIGNLDLRLLNGDITYAVWERLLEHPATLHRTRRIPRAEQHHLMPDVLQPAGEVTNELFRPAVPARRDRKPWRCDDSDAHPQILVRNAADEPLERCIASAARRARPKPRRPK